MVPLLVSIYYVLKKRDEKRWLLILLTVAIFSMNMLALATTAADPPQSLLAVKLGQVGQSLNYFFPLTVFWPFLLITWFLYYVALRRLGVEFGNPWTELKTIRPDSWAKMILGILLAGSVGFAITYLREYQITIFLGSIFAFAVILSFFFSKEEREHTIHWSVETITIFLGFFSVVAFAHLWLHHADISPDYLLVAVIIMTLGADNAAAFAAAYPVYEPLGMTKQLWYNLFPAVVFGGLSPLGNGPQIVTFLVILVAKGVVTSWEVFKGWFIEAKVFFPYLLVWQVGMALIVYKDETPIPHIQFLIGSLATAVCWGAMNMNNLFDRKWD